VTIDTLGAQGVATHLDVANHVIPFHLVIAEMITAISGITILAPQPSMVMIVYKAVAPLHSTLKYWNQ
jgi:hypothetical protein